MTEPWQSYRDVALAAMSEPVVKKDAHAVAIGAILQLPENDIESLTKANKSALKKIFEALANSRPIE